MPATTRPVLTVRAPGPPFARPGPARVVLGVLALVLAVTALGRGIPASATTSATPTAPGTQNVGPRLGWSEDLVYVQSDASKRWPVRTAAERMGQGSPLRLVLVTRCPAPRAPGRVVQCVRVSSADLGGGTLAGRTSWTFSRSTNKLRTATVVLNDRWARTASGADRLNIAEHELGHAVGLPHVERTSSIMNGVAHGRTRPDKGDLRELNARY